MRIVCTEQNNAEWFAARAGKCTASRMADAMARLSRASKNGVKGDWAASHTKYVSELAWELITHVPADHYVSKPMDIGTQYEGEARIEYWMRFGSEVEETGFVLHPTLDYLGCSPDGILGLDGGLEIKVPQFATHCAYLESGEVPEIYKPQMYTNMLCCERKWWDFCSYCPPDIAPEMPDEFRVFRKRLEADAAIFAEIEEVATKTMEEAAALALRLREMYPRDEQMRAAYDERRGRKAEPVYSAAEIADPTSDAWKFLDNSEMVP
jgi:hypothetical protein